MEMSEGRLSGIYSIRRVGPDACDRAREELMMHVGAVLSRAERGKLLAHYSPAEEDLTALPATGFQLFAVVAWADLEDCPIGEYTADPSLTSPDDKAEVHRHAGGAFYTTLRFRRVTLNYGGEKFPVWQRES